MHHLASRESASLPNFIRDVELVWTQPPTVNDRRSFLATEEGTNATDLSPDERAQINVLARKRTLKSLAMATRKPSHEAAATLSILCAKGYVEDDSKGWLERNLSWQRFCKRVAAKANDLLSESPTRMDIDSFTHKLSRAIPDASDLQIRQALVTLKVRGLLLDNLKQKNKAKVSTTKSAEASTKRASPSTKKKGRGRPATRLLTVNTSRKIAWLKSMLGDNCPEGLKLPRLEADGKRQAEHLKAILQSTDPKALIKATDRQRFLIRRMVDEIAPFESITDPTLGNLDLTKKEAAEFIRQWTDRRPASERQITLAKSIEAQLGVPVPCVDGRYFMTAVGEYISKHRIKAKV